MHYVLWSSRVSRKSKHWLLRYSQEKECFSFVCNCFENPVIAIITLEPLVRLDQNVPLLMEFQSNRNLKMSHVRLLTDFARSHHIFWKTMLASNVQDGELWNNIRHNLQLRCKIGIDWKCSNNFSLKNISEDTNFYRKKKSCQNRIMHL